MIVTRANQRGHSDVETISVLTADGCRECGARDFSSHDWSACMRRNKRVVACVAISVCMVGLLGVLCAPARAEEPQPPSQPPAQPGGWGQEISQFPYFNAVIKDMKSMPGLMTLYRYDPADPTKDQTRLVCQIPKNLLKQD